MKSRKFARLDPIEPRIAQFIGDREVYVLRDKKTGTALNVSYSEDGLKWTTNATGKLLYYENARISTIVNLKRSLAENTTVISHVTITSNDGTAPRKSDKVYVERFVPTNQPAVKGQIAEYTWTDKAFRLLTLNAPSLEAERG